MNRNTNHAVESSIDAALDLSEVENGTLQMQQDEDDVTAWMADLQEDWEQEMICQKFAAKSHRAGRHAY